MSDFGVHTGMEDGFVDIRGANNYRCILPPPDGKPPTYAMRTADKGYCKAGVTCVYRKDGCPYYDAYRAAVGSSLVVTNYSYWLHQHAYGEGLGPTETLILDEAHAAPDELAKFLGVHISDQDIMVLGVGYPGISSWREWARLALVRVGAMLKLERMLDNVIHWKLLSTKINRLLMGFEQDWVYEHDGRGARWDIINPSEFAESYLFCGVRDVIFTSATVRPRTMSMLGIKSEYDYDFNEYESTFPVSRRPIYYLPITALSYNNTEVDLKCWRGTIDSIIGTRLDRKGIIHGVSYKRCRDIAKRSKYGAHMITHTPGGTEEAITRFRNSKYPAILVSPTVTTGVDFKFTDAEYQIVPKIPFPDSTSKVLRAREKRDKHYALYLTMMTLVQTTGRCMRAIDDQCETFILDSHFGWLRRRYRKFAPQWFWQAVQRCTSAPAPPQHLTRGQTCDSLHRTT